MLTGADSSFGIPAVRLVRRAGKRKTLYVIKSKIPARSSVSRSSVSRTYILRYAGAARGE
jgi:hypothetical protein